ncbi:YidH family protein [Arthrobacter halodurans]|uniref:YidH family protein n=1 Tax=Arthrobacter halodurans TaxID=516699 RepID=A0ABV4UJD5_9MICC
MSEIPERGWLALRLLPDGEEPDPRFTLANERTFLAWIRTSLAFLAGGIALEAFAAHAFPAPLRTWLAVLVICVGLLIAAGAAFRWLRVESAMRRGRALPLPAVVPLLALGACGAAVVTIAMILLG